MSVHRFKAIWYKTAGNEPLPIVMVQNPGCKYPDTVFFDTDTAASDEDTIHRFSHRWSIEITNRETKSLPGSADPQCRRKQSVTRAPLMAYWSYCFVVVWFVNQLRVGKDLLLSAALWYIKKTITFRICSPRRDAVISPQEFRAIPANTATLRNSSQSASRATVTLSKRQNYRCVESCEHLSKIIGPQLCPSYEKEIQNLEPNSRYTKKYLAK